MAKRVSTEMIKSKAVFEKKIDTIAQLQADIALMVANRDKAKEELLKKWNTEIKAIEGEIKADLKSVLSYADANWPDLAPKKGAKTASTPLANYGFRTGQPTVSLKTRQSKQAEVAEELYREGYNKLVEVSYKLNKPAILNAFRAGVQKVRELFKFNQAERFFVEAKAQKDN